MSDIMISRFIGTFHRVGLNSWIESIAKEKERIDQGEPRNLMNTFGDGPVGPIHACERRLVALWRLAASFCGRQSSAATVHRAWENRKNESYEKEIVVDQSWILFTTAARSNQFKMNCLTSVQLTIIHTIFWSAASTESVKDVLSNSAMRVFAGYSAEPRAGMLKNAMGMH